MDKVDRSVLVWPWSQNLKYHVLLDTFINSQVPSEARCLFPDSCQPDPADPEKLPDPSLNVTTAAMVDASNLTISLYIMASTGVYYDENDPVKARVDRSRLSLNVSCATCDRIVVLVLPDEAEEGSLVWLSFSLCLLLALHNFCDCQTIANRAHNLRQH